MPALLQSRRTGCSIESGLSLQPHGRGAIFRWAYLHRAKSRKVMWTEGDGNARGAV